MAQQAARLILAAFLGWEGLKRYRLLGYEMDWRAILFFVAAILSLILAFTGFRERYRNHDDRN